MKTIRLIVAAWLVCQPLAQAAPMLYGQLNGYFLTNVKDFDDEQTFGLSLGYALSDRHAIEAELQVNGFDSTDPGFEVDADVFTYLLNYDYTFYRSGGLSLSAGLGAGLADTEFGISDTTRGNDTILVWQAELGAKYTFDQGLYAGVNIRLQDFDNMEEESASYDIGTPVVFGLSLGYSF